MHLFRCGTPDGSLDRQYLRVCAAYKLMKRGCIGKARAIQLLTEVRCKHATATVELWIANPFKHLSIAP